MQLRLAPASSRRGARATAGGAAVPKCCLGGGRKGFASVAFVCLACCCLVLLLRPTRLSSSSLGIRHHSPLANFQVGSESPLSMLAYSVLGKARDGLRPEDNNDDIAKELSSATSPSSSSTTSSSDNAATISTCPKLPIPITIGASGSSPWLEEAIQVLLNDPTFTVGLGEELVPAKPDRPSSLVITPQLEHGKFPACNQILVNLNEPDPLARYILLQTSLGNRIRRGLDRMKVAFIAAWSVAYPHTDYCY